MKRIISLLLLSFCSVCYGQVKYDYFPKAELEQDLTFLYDKLTAIHPLLINENYKAQCYIEFEQVKCELKDSMTQNEFYLTIAPLLAFWKDGHSNFVCPTEQRKQYMLSGGLSFPFSVKIVNNSIYITEYYGEDSSLFKGGEEIIQINDIESSQVLKRMQRLIGGKSLAIKNKVIEMNFRNFLWMVHGFEKNYELLVKDIQNQTKQIIVDGITNEQFINNRKRYPAQQQEPYSLSIMNKLAIYTIHTFADLEGFCIFADSAFRVVKENNIENLIIDIRGNGGGRSIVVDSLMNYLTNKSYSQYQKIETRISNDLKAYYKEKYPEKYESIKDFKTDELVSMKIEKTTPIKEHYIFKGKLFLLTDGFTFSGAATFAGLFKEMNLGTIIGEETGGTIEYYGDYWFQQLPNTGLEFHISPKRFVQYGGYEFDRGVVPDYIQNTDSDSIIKFTLSLIQK